jgi:3-oxoacyl-[acyl-carrier-protein] synthase-1
MSTASAPASILSVGMATPLGLNAAATAAAVRAGISRISNSSFYDRNGNPIAMGLMPEDFWNDEAESAEEYPAKLHLNRCVALVVAALDDCLRDSPLERPIPVFLSTPESLPEQPDFDGKQILEQLVALRPDRCDAAASRHFPQGRAGGVYALKAAIEALKKNPDTPILVGGTDSYAEPDRLAQLDEQGRIHGEGCPDGMLLGEAAAFLLILNKEHQPALGHIYSVGLGEEPGHHYSAEPCRGDGLSSAVAEVFQGAAKDVANIATIYASMNGEPLLAHEWGLASLRHRRHFSPTCELFHPAQCIGDVGAASVPLLLGLATIGIHRGYRTSPGFIFCASDLAPRGAVLVTGKKAASVDKKEALRP